jgi:hypothetical protein
MITIPQQEFLDWCFAQPDTRRVNLNQDIRSHDCGCAMVQFGIEREIDFVGVGFCRFFNAKDKTTAIIEFSSDSGVIALLPKTRNTTYGAFKTHLKKLGFHPTKGES